MMHTRVRSAVMPARPARAGPSGATIIVLDVPAI